jgi:hypothetical protein
MVAALIGRIHKQLSFEIQNGVTDVIKIFNKISEMQLQMMMAYCHRICHLHIAVPCGRSERHFEIVSTSDQEYYSTNNFINSKI